MAFMGKTSYVKRVRKHRYIKPVAALLAAVMVCGMAGCDKSENPDSESSSNISQSISDEVSSNNLNEQNGQSSNLALKTEIKVDGHIITIPCMVSNLTDIGMSLDPTTLVSFTDSGGKSTTATQVFYNNGTMGMVVLNGEFTADDDLSGAYVIHLQISEFEAKSCNAVVSYCGLNFQSTKEDVVAELGSDYNDFNGSPHYGTPENHIYFSIGTDNTISNIEITVENQQ